MSMRARSCVGVAIAVLLASARVAAGEPAPLPFTDEGPTPTLIQTTAPRWLCKDKPVLDGPIPLCRELPSGRFIDELSWQGIDTKRKALEDALTRSDAENKSLRESAKGWRPGWIVLTSTLLTGIAVGIYVAR